MHVPVDRYGHFRDRGMSEGRFLAFMPADERLLDPEVFRKGRRITIAGEFMELSPGQDRRDGVHSTRCSGSGRSISGPGNGSTTRRPITIPGSIPIRTSTAAPGGPIPYYYGGYLLRRLLLRRHLEGAAPSACRRTCRHRICRRRRTRDRIRRREVLPDRLRPCLTGRRGGVEHPDRAAPAEVSTMRTLRLLRAPCPCCSAPCICRGPACRSPEVLRVSDGKIITFQQMVDDLRKVSVVFVGEIHDDSGAPCRAARHHQGLS